MKSKYIIAIDQGTQCSKAVLYDTNMNRFALSSYNVTQTYPENGWVEEDPKEILSSVLKAIKTVVLEARILTEDILCIGIANQRQTVVLWDKETGEPVYNAIVWQCRRTSKFCSELTSNGVDQVIKNKTGLILDSYYSASKIKWILDNVPGVRKRAENSEILAGTIDSWLIWNLTGKKVHCTDYTNASATMLYNIYSLEWDKDLLKIFSVPSTLLPKIVNCCEIIGNTELGVCGFSVPITSCISDQQAALFAQGCLEPGETKITYGSGCFIQMNTGSTAYSSNSNLVSTIGIGLGDKIQYILEGSLFSGGSSIEWLKDNLGIIKTAKECDDLAKSVEDTNGVVFVPAFSGLGAPYWDMYARGMIIGLTKGVSRAHICRAALESICYQVKDILDCMTLDTKLPLKALKVDGGVSNSNIMLQFQADILNAAVFRPQNNETTSFGVAFLAGMALGIWTDKTQLLNYWKIDKSFMPVMPIGKRHDLYTQWKKAIERSQGWVPGYLPYKNMEVLEEER